MGGYGSGRPSSHPDTVDNTRRVDIRYMRRCGLLKPLTVGTLSWTRNGHPSGEVSYRVEDRRLVLNYRYRSGGGDWQDVEQAIALETTPCNYGGVRYWLTCPGCLRRCAVLCGAGKLFYCRKCYRLPYQTQLEDDHGRACIKRNNLQSKLYGPNRRRMWNTTRERLVHRLINAEEAANSALAAHLEGIYGKDFLRQ